MGRRESSKDIDFEVEGQPSGRRSAGSGGSKASGISEKAAGVIKFILGVCLLPFVYGATVSFMLQIKHLDKLSQAYFWGGLGAFLITHLFIWESIGVYNGGHKLLELIFSFFQPLVDVAPYLLPIYTLLVMVGYGVLCSFVKTPQLLDYTLFAVGFTVAMHIVYSARSVQTKTSDFLKGNYIFGFSFVYIVNVALVAFFLGLVFKEYSCIEFSKGTYYAARDVFGMFFNQLFVPAK